MTYSFRLIFALPKLLIFCCLFSAPHFMLLLCQSVFYKCNVFNHHCPIFFAKFHSKNIANRRGVRTRTEFIPVCHPRPVEEDIKFASPIIASGCKDRVSTNFFFCRIKLTLHLKVGVFIIVYVFTIYITTVMVPDQVFRLKAQTQSVSVHLKCPL